MKIVSWIRICAQGAWLNGRHIHLPEGEWAEEAYRQAGTNYPKFFKMDRMCQAGWMASELLLREDSDRFVPRDDRAVILLSHAGCLCNDLHYQNTIQDSENYFPSPALFVYTLSNILTGEIAIRNKYLGETSCYLLPKWDATALLELSNHALQDATTRSLLTGWVDCMPDQSDDILLCLVTADGGMAWNEENIKQLYEYGRI